MLISMNDTTQDRLLFGARNKRKTEEGRNKFRWSVRVKLFQLRLDEEC